MGYDCLFNFVTQRCKKLQRNYKEIDNNIKALHIIIHKLPMKSIQPCNILLPIEIVRHIVSFVQDASIDLRREYNVYSKLDMSPYKNKTKGFVKRWNIRSKTHHQIDMIAELHNDVARTHESIHCDAIHATILFDHIKNTVKYELSIVKLKPKLPNRKNNDCPFIIPYPLAQHYEWESMMYDYTRSSTTVQSIVLQQRDKVFQMYSGAVGHNRTN